MKLDSIILYSHDIEVVIPFYRDVLRLNFEYQQNDTYVSFLLEDGVRLGIKKATESRELPGAQTVFFSVEAIDEVYRTLQDRGAEPYKQLEVKPWGKEFSVLDPDGNKILLIDRMAAVEE